MGTYSMWTYYCEPFSCSYFTKIMLQHFEKLMENVQEDEPNTIDMRVDSSMSKEEVVAEVFLKIEEVTENK